MIPINNSDTAWLITADFNQENGLPYLDLIEDINNPEIDQWYLESQIIGIGGVFNVGDSNSMLGDYMGIVGSQLEGRLRDGNVSLSVGGFALY